MVEFNQTIVKETMSDIKNLSQSNSTMFERNIAIKASKEEMVEVQTQSNSFHGFMCGLDENWIQICGNEEDEIDSVKEWDLVLLNLKTIVSIQSIGTTSHDLEDSIKEYVQKKIYNFSTVSKAFLEKKK
jgi:hypothetical protein